MGKYLQYAKRNIRRTPFQAIAASMVMFLTFFALLIFLTLAAGSQEILRFYESKPQVIIFFKDNTSAADVNAIQNALSQEARVASTNYVSQEEALQIYKERNKSDPALLELVTANILPASLEISAKTPEDLGPIAELMSKEPVVDQVLVPKEVVANLTAATRVIRIVGLTTVTFLTAFSLLIILMIIGFKIRLKRSEIEIMMLIGAPNSLIRMPFILEGIFYAAAGALSAWVITYTLLWYFSPFLQNYLGEVQLLPVNPLFMLSLLGVSLVISFIIGGIGSLMAVRRYLRI
ncbi:MAG: ABC transporter permease [Candidatus Daviesbacteria bacterium]|nr:MAG: ABC transporter permease [Candidatus Daviesbacteria bacterium]